MNKRTPILPPVPNSRLIDLKDSTQLTGTLVLEDSTDGTLYVYRFSRVLRIFRIWWFIPPMFIPLHRLKKVTSSQESESLSVSPPSTPVEKSERSLTVQQSVWMNEYFDRWFDGYEAPSVSYEKWLKERFTEKLYDVDNVDQFDELCLSFDMLIKSVLDPKI